MSELPKSYKIEGVVVGGAQSGKDNPLIGVADLVARLGVAGPVAASLPNQQVDLGQVVDTNGRDGARRVNTALMAAGAQKSAVLTGVLDATAGVAEVLARGLNGNGGEVGPVLTALAGTALADLTRVEVGAGGTTITFPEVEKPPESLPGLKPLLGLIYEATTNGGGRVLGEKAPDDVIPPVLGVASNALLLEAAAGRSVGPMVEALARVGNNPWIEAADNMPAAPDVVGQTGKLIEAGMAEAAGLLAYAHIEGLVPSTIHTSPDLDKQGVDGVVLGDDGNIHALQVKSFAADTQISVHTIHDSGKPTGVKLPRKMDEVVKDMELFARPGTTQQALLVQVVGREISPQQVTTALVTVPNKPTNLIHALKKVLGE